MKPRRSGFRGEVFFSTFPRDGFIKLLSLLYNIQYCYYRQYHFSRFYVTYVINCYNNCIINIVAIAIIYPASSHTLVSILRCLVQPNPLELTWHQAMDTCSKKSIFGGKFHHIQLVHRILSINSPGKVPS